MNFQLSLLLSHLFSSLSLPFPLASFHHRRPFWAERINYTLIPSPNTKFHSLTFISTALLCIMDGLLFGTRSQGLLPIASLHQRWSSFRDGINSLAKWRRIEISSCSYLDQLQWSSTLSCYSCMYSFNYIEWIHIFCPCRFITIL